MTGAVQACADGNRWRAVLWVCGCWVMAGVWSLVAVGCGATVDRMGECAQGATGLRDGGLCRGASGGCGGLCHGASVSVGVWGVYKES